jgi:LPXTG-site transpeptidase (sortase) family protein
LNIDEPVQTIPIHDGEWDLTTLGTGVGWLTTTGARPGDAWAMAFIGHITVSAKEHGAFAYLQKIQKDAEVIYQLAGNNYIYYVESISRAGPNDVNRLYLADGKSLLLITCTDWDETQRVYASRLVVQARLKE